LGQTQTLSGESLEDSTPRITGVHCDLDRGGTFSYHAEGVASGPYAGTFTENGTVAFGPQNINVGSIFPAAQWRRISAVFTIHSEQGLVVGRKTLTDATVNYPTNELDVCARFPNPTASPDVTSGYAIGGTSDQLEYNARIIRRGETSVDSGQSYFTMADFNYFLVPYGPQVGSIFFENFTSNQGPPPHDPAPDRY
jgi:hypothetical protein